MEIVNAAKKDSAKGMKYREIAEKYGVSESAVKSWASRYWKSQPKKKKVATKNKRPGAPKGNKNAVGNNGGAPIGNQNALTHGGYSAIYWDTLTDDEKDLIDTMPKSEEELLLDTIRLCSIRERRLLQAIEKVKATKGEQVLESITRIEDKRSFADKEEEAEYNLLKAEKIAAGGRMPGEKYHLQTNTESKSSALLRIEQELTRVQKAKEKAISSLAKLNIEKQKLELIKESDDIEIEDTSETDGAIYG